MVLNLRFQIILFIYFGIQSLKFFLFNLLRSIRLNLAKIRIIIPHFLIFFFCSRIIIYCITVSNILIFWIILFINFFFQINECLRVNAWIIIILFFLLVHLVFLVFLRELFINIGRLLLSSCILII